MHGATKKITPSSRQLVYHSRKENSVYVIDKVTQVIFSSTRSRILTPWQRSGYRSEFSAQPTFPFPLVPSPFHSSSHSTLPTSSPARSTNLPPPHSDANENGEHGTEDFAQGSKPIFDARRLKVMVDNDPNRDDVPAPRFNAESYAGAATELWAQKFCQKEFIPPQNGYQT